MYYFVRLLTIICSVLSTPSCGLYSVFGLLSILSGWTDYAINKLLAIVMLMIAQIY